MSVATLPVESNVVVANDRQWKARLNCTFEAGPQRTIVRRDHRGPLSIQRPYYPEGKTAHVYILHPPGGIAAGDNLQLNVQGERNSRGLISTPGAAKFYRSEGAQARVHQRIKCAGNSLEWLPQENIFFNGCHARLSTNIDIENQVPLVWWEINCFGRPNAAAPFETGSVENTVQLRVDSSLILRDRQVVDASQPLGAITGMRGFNVSASLLITPVHTEVIDNVRVQLQDATGFYATNLDGLLLIRYLGDSSETAKSVFTGIWSSLRKSLNKNNPQTPRIWAT